MLFNSEVFIFGFLPVVIAGFFLVRFLSSHRMALVWLTGASLFFYGWWDPRYLWLIAASVIFNFLIGRSLILAHPGAKSCKGILAFGVACNLMVIAYFKYTNFIIDNLSVAGVPLAVRHIVLPLGISFFTFTQIAFLVDSYQRKASEPDFLKYTLFVTYFPHLIAGPIIHHKDVMGQMSDSRISVWSSHRFAVGITIFIIGLFKKVAIADFLSPYPDSIFHLADKGVQPGFAVCWVGALCYALQIYFDFSGYSDMAIGLSRMFGIQLPINFNSPYKSGSVTEFWRRWHISLSRFLRDYLYFPLGGNRHGKLRRYANLLTTMILGGLWHGAGWPFLAWGALHGFYLVCNHVWRGVRKTIALPVTSVERLLGWALTFGAVIVAWVFFRASSLASARIMLHGMAQGSGVADMLRLAAGRHVRADAFWLLDSSVRFKIAAALLIALAMPNTSQILSRFRPGLSLYGEPEPSAFQWRLSWGFASAAALLFFVSLALLGRPASFIYFNF